jgi:ketosteroid isomerase-like protein
VAAYVEATNSFDLERLMATFAEDALVNDQLRDHWGKPAIREWVKREIIGVRLTMNVTKVINQNRASVRSAGHGISWPPPVEGKLPPSVS